MSPDATDVTSELDAAERRAAAKDYEGAACRALSAGWLLQVQHLDVPGLRGLIDTSRPIRPVGAYFESARDALAKGDDLVSMCNLFDVANVLLAISEGSDPATLADAII